MTNKKAYKAGILFSLANAVTLGTLGIIDKIGATQTGINPFTFSTQSVLFGFLFITLYALIVQRSTFIHDFKQTTMPTWQRIILVGIFASGFNTFLRFIGLTQSTGTFATLGQIIITAMSAVLAYFFLKEKLSKPFWALFFLIIVATYFVSVGKLSLTALQLGDSYILLGTVFVAVANILSKQATNQTSPLVLTVGRFFFASIFLLNLQLLFMNQPAELFTFSIWAVISGLLWSFNTTVYNMAMHKIGVTLATSILMLAPVVTIILEFIILKHIFTPVQIVAAAVVIICGMLLIRFK